MPHAVVDVSALIARLDRHDTAHERCVDALSRIRDSLTTVWPALTEAMHLVADTRGGPDAPCTMVSDGVLTLLDLAESDLARVTSSPSFATSKSTRLPRRGKFTVLPLPMRRAEG